MKSSLTFAAVLLVVAGLGAFVSTRGGFSDWATVRVDARSDAPAGVISEGAEVDLAAFARSSGRTVFFFTKPWCGACRRTAPRIEDAVRADPDASLRVIDIGSWDSPVARQYGIRAVPHVVLYEDGRPSVSGIDAVLARLAR